MNKIWIILVLSLAFFSFDLSQRTVKKIDKALSKLYPEQSVTKKAINFTVVSQKELSFKLENNTLFSVLNNSKPDSYMFLSKGVGKMNEFDYMVVFNKDLSIKKIKLLVYREEYGGEIGSNRWLKQFVGKKDPKGMKFGHDIQNISGATISARSLTEDVRNVTLKMMELRKKGMI